MWGLNQLPFQSEPRYRRSYKLAWIPSDVLNVSVIGAMLLWFIGCDVANIGTNKVHLNVWTTSTYGGKRPENTNFYSVVNKDLASVSYVYPQKDEDKRDTDLVLQSLEIIRSQFGRSYRDGGVHQDMQGTRFQPTHLVILVSRQSSRVVRVAAILEFDAAFAPKISETDIFLLKGVAWNEGETTDRPVLRAYEEFLGTRKNHE